MKAIILTAFIVSVLVSCEKKHEEKVTDTQSYELQQQPIWAVEKFKTDYTIQFPSGYTGGINGFEGNIFNKMNAAIGTRVSYAYCNSLVCYDFHDVLSNPLQASILYVINQNSSPELLRHRVEFTLNNQLTGVLYHNNEAELKGVLFWKNGGFFKEAAFIDCQFQNLPQVIDILRTIKEK
jgi:hypothetical protein